MRYRKDSEEIRSRLLHKIECHRDALVHRQRDAFMVGNAADMERVRAYQLVEHKFALSVKHDAIHDEVRHVSDMLSLLQKTVEIRKQQLHKKLTLANASQLLLPTLRSKLKDSSRRSHSASQRTCELQITVTSCKDDIDMWVARLLHRDGAEESSQSELRTQLQEVATLETDVSTWSLEGARQRKLVVLLQGYRELNFKEIARAMVTQVATEDQLRLKGLACFDLSKRCLEQGNRHQEFAALYDAVKNERNKYAQLVQSSLQALAEMKEKTKILVNESEVLRTDLSAKEKALTRERSHHHSSQMLRDAFRLESCTAQVDYRDKQQAVEQHMITIINLSAIISSHESSMLKLKIRHDLEIEKLNIVGASLIDRNDELCIFYEKLNFQRQALCRGHQKAHEMSGTLQMLRIVLVGLQLEDPVFGSRLPFEKKLTVRVMELRGHLESERRLTDVLCGELETPAHGWRCRRLCGLQFKFEEVALKVESLLQELNMQKETLFESELVLDEITQMSLKLSKKAESSRSPAVWLARVISWNVANLNVSARRSAAVLSEWSFYRTCSERLRQERTAWLVKLSCLTCHSSHEVYFLAPSKARLQFRTRAPSCPTIPAQTCATKRAASGTSADSIESRAEPRPSAYVPNPSRLGIPKPYSELAPFMPNATGAIFRHIRQSAALPLSM
mmetsp:Transcript_29019/g.88676  ORF Transcript_29019/g.88676 Transcript_29019/m.88676 type:complete len:677 (+) Transcript_29019:1413-3443(+)